MAGRVTHRWRWAIVVAWLAVTVAAVQLLPGLAETQSDSVGDLVATDAQAIQTEIRSVEEFEFPLLSRTIIVQRNPRGLSAAELANHSRRVGQLIAGELEDVDGIAFALPATNVLGEPPFSREESTTALTYLFFPPEIGPVGRNGLARRFIERYLEPAQGTYVGVTGAASARAEQRKQISEGLIRVELATMILVLIAVAVHFRSVLAPLVNLAAVAVAYLVSSHLLGAVGILLGVGIPPEVEPVMVALLFGVVTDYTIFYLSRFRGWLAEGEAPKQAAGLTARELFWIIAVAGLTVAAATATLLLAELGFFRAFGPGLALSILVALAVTMTLVPALLGICGRRLLWPGGSWRRGGGRSRALEQLRQARAALLRCPTERPLATAAAAALPLLILASFLPRLEVGNRTIAGLPAGSEPRVAYNQAGKGFAPGILSPTLVLVEGEGIAEQRDRIVRLQRLIARRSKVAQVLGPRQAPLPVEYGAVFSETGDAARLFVVLDQNPLGSRAIDTVQHLDEDLPRLLQKAGLPEAEANLAGDTALSAETVDKSSRDLARVVPAATLVVFIILALFLRALVAPLYLVMTSLLALAASLGLTVLVFQEFLGYDDLAFYVPFAATVLLLALGSDYNVYLVGRIWDEARRQRSLRKAVEVAGVRAASAITVAALVLAGSFASLALVPLRPFQEIAFAVAAGLLLEAFIVRSLLAPALIVLVGEKSAWPGKGLRVNQASKAPAESSDG